jgi:hypothetical protein
MKINEKLGLFLMDEDHFISLLFTRNPLLGTRNTQRATRDSEHGALPCL